MMGMTTGAEQATDEDSRSDSDNIPEELRAFVRLRGRPGIFLFLNEGLSLSHALSLRDALGNHRYEELDIIVNSLGGDIDVAYQIVELLRLRVGKIHACVPFYAKSAATLLCIGADTITLDELAQLGPLDAQIYEEAESGKGEYHSALNAFKTLEQLHAFAITTLDSAMQTIAARGGLNANDCFRNAVAYVQAVTGPLFAKLNPEKLGEYNRALTVGEEYCKRLFRRYTNWDEEKAAKIARQLVYSYPSHEYIIDFNELRDMGFQASLFGDVERAAVQGLMQYTDDTFITCVEP